MRHHINRSNSYLHILIAALFFSLLTQGCGRSLENRPNSQQKESADNTLETNTAPAADNPSVAPESLKINSVAQNLPIDQAAENFFPQAETEASSDNSSSPDALHVDGSRLTDSSGNPVQLRGISTHGLAWFPDYINEDCFRQLKNEWHINVIRLAMYTAEYGGYCTGGDQARLKELVKNGVEYATSSGMYVIIDWHILSDGNPNTYKEEAKSFFAEMAELYAGYDNVLYEICNEPNCGTSWIDIKSYAEEIIPVIRSYDREGIIIVGTPNWSQYVDQAAADPVTGYDNIMYSLHFYAATHTDSLRNTMISAIEAGLPVFVSEYGICDASGNGAIDEYQADQWISLMDEYNISYVAWNLSNKEETSAILSSKCSKTCGFTEDDLSPSGKWLYRMFSDTCSYRSFPKTSITTIAGKSATSSFLTASVPRSS